LQPFFFAKDTDFLGKRENILGSKNLHLVGNALGVAVMDTLFAQFTEDAKTQEEMMDLLRKFSRD